MPGIGDNKGPITGGSEGRARGAASRRIEMSRAASEVRRVVESARASVSLASVELPEEFFPAHLSVALVDAVFRSPPGGDVEAIVDRYCRRFGIARTRSARVKPPPQAEQEALGDLVRHFDVIGLEAMRDEVFGTRVCSPGTSTAKAESVLGAARALRDIGLETLQDVPLRRPEEIEDTLWPLIGIGGCTVRLLLMYTGSEDFVRGDFHIRNFVARAIGRRSLSSGRAESLMREAAHELIVSPRFLDRAIWEYEMAATGVFLESSTNGDAGVAR